MVYPWLCDPVVRGPVLSNDEAVALLVAARSGDGSARDLLIRHFIRFAIHVSKRFFRWGEDVGMPREDVIGCAFVGLMRTVDTCDVDGDTCVAAYISRGIRNHVGNALHKWASSPRTVSFFEEADYPGTERNDPFVRLTETEQLELLDSALAAMPEREARLLRLRYGLGGEEVGPKDIASVLGIGDALRIAPLESEAIERLRERLAEGLGIALRPGAAQSGARTQGRGGRPPIDDSRAGRIRGLWRCYPDASGRDIAHEYEQTYGERVHHNVALRYRPDGVTEAASGRRGSGRRISEAHRGLIRRLWEEMGNVSPDEICQAFLRKAGRPIDGKTARRYRPRAAS